MFLSQRFAIITTLLYSLVGVNLYEVYNNEIVIVHQIYSTFSNKVMISVVKLLRYLIMYRSIFLLCMCLLKENIVFL